MIEAEVGASPASPDPMQGSPVMKPFVALAAIALLAACSPKAQNETADAANTISADADASMNQAASDVSNAADRDFGAAEARIDKSTDDASNAADDLDQSVDDTGTGNDVED
jgi:uncharacterized lipoprotein YajG